MGLIFDRGATDPLDYIEACVHCGRLSHCCRCGQPGLARPVTTTRRRAPDKPVEEAIDHFEACDRCGQSWQVCECRPDHCRDCDARATCLFYGKRYCADCAERRAKAAKNRAPRGKGTR